MLRDFRDGQRLVAMSCVAVALALFVARRAMAQAPQRYAVRWTTAEGAQSCLQQTELSAAVGKLVAADLLTTPERAERLIFGQAQRDASWHARLRVLDAAGNLLGEREINSDAAACTELSASVALAIALIIDPDHIPAEAKALGAEVRATLPAPPAAASGGSQVPVSRVASASVATRRESPSRLTVYRPPPRRALKVGAVLLSGLLPEVAIGAQLEFWQPLLRLHSLRLALGYFAAQTRDVPGNAGVSATLYLVTARAAYCPLLAAGPDVSVFGCAGLESGLMVAHGQGGAYDNTPAHALLALDGALTVDWSLAGPWAMSLTGGAAVALFRRSFYYSPGSEPPIEVYRQGPLEGRLEIALAYRF